MIATRKRWKLHSCPRCKGDLNIQQEEYEAVWKCLQCSHTISEDDMKGINLGEKNGMWKGDKASVWAGYIRARPKYALQPCAVCGGVTEIHHIDGNTLKNIQGNIAFLCRKHHMEEDGRMQSRNKKGQFGQPEEVIPVLIIHKKERRDVTR